MENKKFRLIKWYPSLGKKIKNDDIVEFNEQYGRYIVMGGDKSYICHSSEIENSSDFWRPYFENNFKIIEFIKNGCKISCLHSCGFDDDIINNYLSNGYKIWKIQRLSDNKIFTIGDECKHPFIGDEYQIKNFEIYTKEKDNIVMSLSKFAVEGELVVAVGNFTPNCFLDKLEHFDEKEPPKFLFKTEDDVDVFEGDFIYYVGNNFTQHKTQMIDNNHLLINDFVKFSTIEKANEYIDNYKPMYSFQELKNIIVDIKEEHYGVIFKNIIQLEDLEKLKQRKCEKIN